MRSSCAQPVSHWMGRPLLTPSPTPPLVATTCSGKPPLRWKGTSMVERPTSPSTPGVLLPRHFNWRSTTPSQGLMRHVSTPQTPLKHYPAPVAPHSTLPNTSLWSVAGSSNTSSIAASFPSTAPSATPSCMHQSRTLIASLLSFRPATRPSGLKPARRFPHPLSLTREVSTVSLSPLYP
jgi:hypothetical protein